MSAALTKALLNYALCLAVSPELVRSKTVMGDLLMIARKAGAVIPDELFDNTRNASVILARMINELNEKEQVEAKEKEAQPHD